ncbi:Hpt domain-containing protein [Nitrosomonas sp.]|uniref:Hpt domain-containing protein n=1 Tax=Nitrosomonas sp. TaxID=42353 RepID=UPI001D622304|nr:Hpt domain-containing protein [Nitrosomonas sp.]MBX3617198.1 Hpt domain-containing protein [Nitrosomonas sp.]
MSFDPQDRIPSISVVNFDKLDALRRMDPAGGADFLKRLVGIFLASTPGAVMRIEAAIQADDRIGMIQAVHSLRSSAANVGAEQLSDICRLLEDSGDHLQKKDIVELLSKLQHEFQLVTIALQDLQKDF